MSPLTPYAYILHHAPNFCTMHQTFTPLKASQKLGIGREWFALGQKPVYEIKPSQVAPVSAFEKFTF